MIKRNINIMLEEYTATIERINKAIDVAKQGNSDSCKVEVPTEHVFGLTRELTAACYGFFITIDGHKVNTRLATCLIFFYSNPQITSHQ